MHSPSHALSDTARATTGTGSKTLGPGLLTALVVGSMVGSGIFGLPQNMAQGAGAGAILIGWGISGLGMLMLALVFQRLARARPELNNGVYAYARALAGDYVGFNSAWGYWVSAWVGNVGYLVAVLGSLGYFFPAFGEGNTPAAVLGASVLLWLVHLMVLRGIQGAAVLNALVTVAKLLPLLLFILLVGAAFQAERFRLDFWGAPTLGSVLGQVKSTMLVTVWVFIGVEGASVYSARARRRDHVGRATVAGFLVCLLLMMAVSLLSLGIMGQPQLAALKNPSMAPVLAQVVGSWGAVLIYLGLVVSVGGAFLAWTLLAAESLFTPAGAGVMPAWLGRQNQAGVPANALWLTNGMVQLFLVLTLFSQATYLALISLATAMILVPYLFSAAYGMRAAWQDRFSSLRSNQDLPIAALATLYCLWLLYAAGLKYLLLSALLYAPGAALFLLARHQAKATTGAKGLPALTGAERLILLALLALAVCAATLLYRGSLSL